MGRRAGLAARVGPHWRRPAPDGRLRTSSESRQLDEAKARRGLGLRAGQRPGAEAAPVHRPVRAAPSGAAGEGLPVPRRRSRAALIQHHDRKLTTMMKRFLNLAATLLALCLCGAAMAAPNAYSQSYPVGPGQPTSASLTVNGV